MGLCESFCDQDPQPRKIKPRKDSIPISVSTTSSRRGSFSEGYLKRYIDDLFVKYDA